MEVPGPVRAGCNVWVLLLGDRSLDLYEAYYRFRDVPEVQGGIVLLAGGAGLVANPVSAWTLRRSAGHSLNVEGAFLHVMADLVGAIGVVASGTLTLAFGRRLADPILGVFLSLLVVASSWRLVTKVFQVLLEGSPATSTCTAFVRRWKTWKASP